MHCRGALSGRQDQLGTVTKAVAADVIVAHFDDQLGSQRLPFGRPLRRPAARSTRRFASETRCRDQLLQPLRQLRLFIGRERGCEPDVVQQAIVAIESQQQRADQLAAALVAEAADHAIGGAQTFDLEHGPLAGRVRQIEALGDDAVGLHMFAVQPSLCLFAIAGEGRDKKRRAFAGAVEQGFEGGAALREWRLQQRAAGIRDQAIEGDECGRLLVAQLGDALFRRVQPHLQGVESERTIDGDQQLAVEHQFALWQVADDAHHVGKKAVERLA